ncbi:MAG: hypothetical protein LUH42_04670 [Oscillospiraceae bacterium]|nr:hypothetical protein [Oscillospiraceae bacterium]
MSYGSARKAGARRLKLKYNNGLPLLYHKGYEKPREKLQKMTEKFQTRGKVFANMTAGPCPAEKLVI